MALIHIPQRLLKYYLFRYPPQARLTQFNFLLRWAWLGDILNEIRPELFPPDAPPQPDAEPVVNEMAIAPVGVQMAPSPYRHYRCKLGDPLNCMEPVATIREDTKAMYCRACNFPAVLPPKAEILGRKGIYRIHHCLGRRGRGRLYAAIQKDTDAPVVVKEFLLPQRYFNAEERRRRQDVFISLAGINLADGRSQDFRLMAPAEAIADAREERCYLISEGRDASPTLNRCLATLGAMPALQVRRVLNQVLQTLEFLHQQKFSLPMGQIQTGVVHGNLNLDSLLVLSSPSAVPNTPSFTPAFPTDWNAEFFIYLSDLELWERLVEPGLIEMTRPTVADDLMALGYIAFYLLAGKTLDETGHPLDPKNEAHWVPIPVPLKSFILQLLGLKPPFATAEAARRALLQLPVDPVISALDVPSTTTEIHQRRSYTSLLAVLAALLVLALLGAVLWRLLKPKPETIYEPALCCLKDVSAVPEGEYTYTGAQDGVWGYVLKQVNLPTLPQASENLADYLTKIQPKLKLNYRESGSIEQAIANVQSRAAAFAIIPLFQSLPDDLQAEIVAYDGLAIFVPFSYAERQQGLPVALNGQLTLEQIKQLYMNDIRNWQELGASRLPVKVYFPAEPESLEFFQKRVLGDESVATFRNRLPGQAQVLPAIEMMRSIIRDFEVNQAGGIGFAPFSQVFGQCSVYPLAVRTEKQPAIQALLLDADRPIDPNTDLCDRKGSYFLSLELFQSGRYPLAYPIAIVSLKDNSLPPVGEKFADLLKTEEGQKLLTEAGLVPLDAAQNDGDAEDTETAVGY